MANLALIKGARDAANKYMDPALSVRQAVLRGEQAFLRRQALQRAEKEKSENFRLQLLSRMDMIKSSKLAPQLRDWSTNASLKVQEQFRNTLNDPNISKEDQIIAFQQYNASIDNIRTKNDQFKEWLENYALTENDLISDLNDPEQIAKIRAIGEGNFKVTEDGMFQIGEGDDAEIVDIDNMLNSTEILKNFSGYKNLLAEFQMVGLDSGLKGLSEEFFNKQVDLKFNASSLNEMNNEGLASIVVDFIAKDSIDPETIKDNQSQMAILSKALKEDYKDDGKLNQSTEASKNLTSENYRDYLMGYIKDNVKAAIKDQYTTGYKEYQSKLAAQAKAGVSEKQIKADENIANFNYKVDQNLVNLGLNQVMNEAGLLKGNATFDDINLINFSTRNDKFVETMTNLGFNVEFEYAIDEEGTEDLNNLRGVTIQDQAGTKKFYLPKGASLRNFLELAYNIKSDNFYSDARATMKVNEYFTQLQGGASSGAFFRSPTKQQTSSQDVGDVYSPIIENPDGKFVGPDGKRFDGGELIQRGTGDLAPNKVYENTVIKTLKDKDGTDITDDLLDSEITNVSFRRKYRTYRLQLSRKNPPQKATIRNIRALEKEKGFPPIDFTEYGLPNLDPNHKGGEVGTLLKLGEMNQNYTRTL
tara:strand:+ start:87 stop:2018 length:1932 start_codon:yes stop_codon:yes gene_type:complete